MRVALWLRVSKGEQHTANQGMALREMAEGRGWQIVKEYRLEGASAWKGEHQDALRELLEAARRKEFDIVLVWALDRLDRGGIASMLALVRQFDAADVRLVSYQEGWIETVGELRDLMLSVLAWAAKYESTRRSERIKAGLARRKAQGLTVGRQVGAKDKGKRRRSGYVRRWEDERA